MEWIKKNNEKIKKIFNQILKVISFMLIIAASIGLGIFYEKNNTVKIEKPNVTKVGRSDVRIAIDESNNLIIINNESGEYAIYQDSIGKSIFNIYARSIWAQNMNK